MPAINKNLLLVEDDASLRALLSAILTRSGYSVRVAEDGFSALAEIRAGLPDILLSDLYMVGMSGFELLSVVRRRFPSISVIAMSSAFSTGDVPAGVAADAFYQKATSVLSLLRLIEQAELPGHLHLVRPAAPTPIWVTPNISGSATHLIACPDCLRAAAYPLTRGATVLQQTDCLHCGIGIPYAMLQSVDPGPSIRKPWRLGPNAPSALLSATS